MTIRQDDYGLVRAAIVELAQERWGQGPHRATETYRRSYQVIFDHFGLFGADAIDDALTEILSAAEAMQPQPRAQPLTVS